jgi:putative two-component system response regulator
VMAREIALNHHEKWDGSGYPDGLRGEDIPFSGRIAALADVFDALTSARPYKKAWPVEDAVELIRENRGAHFDPELVDLFLADVASFVRIMDVYQD